MRKERIRIPRPSALCHQTQLFGLRETDPAPSAAQAFSSPNTLLRAAEGPEIVKAVRVCHCLYLGAAC
jgi:hypothetical protein